MILLPADDICRNWPQQRIKLLIPGGWNMVLPEISVDDDYREHCLQYFIRKVGASKAAMEAAELIQATGSVGFKASLVSSIFYFAKMYCKMYPERLEPARFRKRTWQPLGFDPEAIQRYHVPTRYPGKQGIQIVKKALLEMGKDP